MCGIFGILSEKNLSNKEIYNLKKIMDKRGPDSKGVFHDIFDNKYLTFIFSRLSIIDLDKKANQPFKKFNKIIMFNGEIYNYLELRKELENKYKFYTSSDTEVLVTAYQEYGTNFLKKIEGMFSIIIFDKDKDYIFFCRDRFGEKPLYYYNHNKKLIFGSELKYIKQQIRNLSLNNKKISNFLIKGYRTYLNNDDTIYNEIKTFPKGEYWIYKNGSFKSHKKYWSLNYCPNKNLTTKIATEIVEEKLINSIKIRLRSDVDVALSLSGGIDSSLIAAIASKKFNKIIDSFSIIDSDERYNESKNINSIYKKYEFRKSYKLKLNKKNFIKNLRLQIASHQSPVLTLSSYINNLLSKKVGSTKNKVIFSGVASDELFSGYYDYGSRWLYEMRNEKNHKKLINEWCSGTGRYIENPILIKSLREKIKPSSKNLFHGEEEFKLIMNRKFCTTTFKSKKYSISPLRNQMLNDLFHEVVPTILNQEDLNYMDNSVENRCPFLDKSLAEFAYTIPNKLLIQKGMNKYILRNIGKKYLPKSINLDKRKRGFNASIESLLDLNDKSNLALILDNSKIFDFVNKSKLEKFLNRSDFKDNSFSKFLFNFISVKLFLDDCV